MLITLFIAGFIESQPRPDSLQASPVTWTVSTVAPQSEGDSVIYLQISGKPANGWYVYALTHNDASEAIRVSIPSKQPFKAHGSTTSTLPGMIIEYRPAEYNTDDGDRMGEYRSDVYRSSFNLLTPVIYDGILLQDKLNVRVLVRYRACNSNRCQPVKTVVLKVDVSTQSRKFQLSLPFITDTLRTKIVRPGVILHYIHAPAHTQKSDTQISTNTDTTAGPWGIHVLDVRMGGNRSDNKRHTIRRGEYCYSAVAVKGGEGAAGKETTTSMLQELNKTQDVIGGINADFWDPRSSVGDNGVPRGAFVSRGRVVAGPSASPVLAFDADGTPHITALRAAGSVTVGWLTHEISGWNRTMPRGLALFDANWGGITDADSGTIEVVLNGAFDSRDLSHIMLGNIVEVDTTKGGVSIPKHGAVLVAGREAPTPLRAALLALRPGNTVGLDLSLLPIYPREAVSGYPVLIRDSALVDGGEKSKTSFATGRPPRAAIGIGRDENGGKRLILVVVDEDRNNKLYSNGMTLRDLANLLLALGAHDAINLDGSGSATLVYTEPGLEPERALRIANRPADRNGSLKRLTTLLDPVIGIRTPNTVVWRFNMNSIGIYYRHYRYWNTELSSGRFSLDLQLQKIRRTTREIQDTTHSSILYKRSPGWERRLTTVDRKFPIYAYTPNAMRPVERRVANALAIVRGCPAS